MTRISDSGLSVAVVGATGQVGTVMREILAERDFPIRELRLFATARSAGTAVEFAGATVIIEDVATADPAGIDVPGLLDRIELEMATAPSEVQWTMNTTLAQIGIHFPELRARALAIGEKLGIYRDYPVSKGCTSPFAPIWINEMVSRQNK